MYQTRPQNKGRYEPRYEDDRGSPYGYPYDRPRDLSPQRNPFERALDPRANPHSEGYHRTVPVQGQRYFENRYHRMPDERRRPPVEEMPWQPAGHMQTQYQRDEDYHPGHYDANKGYLVMVRFRPTDLADVITAVQESVSTLTAHDGYCIGFSEPKLMHIVMPSHQSLASDRWWDPRDQRQSRYAVACFWFKDYIHARDWFQTGSVRFKQPEFPNSNPYQVVAIPLTYGRNKDPTPFTPDRDEVTLLWSEYPGIFERYEYDFFDHYSRPENHIMRRYGGNPYVSACKYKAGDITPLNKFGSPGYARFEVPVERVARSWRGSWIAPDTVITVSTFPSMKDVSQFYYDPEYTEIKRNLSRYTEPVIVAITLKKVQGTTRR